MRKIYSTLFCLFCISILASRAQNAAAPFHVNGQVIDSLSGAPLAGATIEFGAFTNTITTGEGQFEFRLTRPGTYTLKVTNIGYLPYETALTVPGAAPSK